MKKIILFVAMLSACASTSVSVIKVYDENSLNRAVEAANMDSNIKTVIFEKDAHISLNAPVIFTGSQAITFIGNGASIDGSDAGSFVLDADLTAVTEDGTLVFNTASSVSIQNLSVENSATRGIVINIPETATEDVSVTLKNVEVINSALYGFHIDDNAHEFDEGSSGSEAGIELNISHSRFIGNGTGAIDFDGVRVDERSDGDIRAVIMHTNIDANGGDGIELDEAGNGDVDVTIMHVTLNDNGFYNEEDLDDGFDIDEADEGSIIATLLNVKVENNRDEGLDFDEAGEGDVKLRLHKVVAINNTDEGIKADEADAGNIEAELSKTKVMKSGDDGIQFTELGEGYIRSSLKKVTATDNKKYGIKIEQWFVENEASHVEEAGELKLKEVTLSGSGEGDDIKTNNIEVKE